MREMNTTGQSLLMISKSPYLRSVRSEIKCLVSQSCTFNFSLRLNGWLVKGILSFCNHRTCEWLFLGRHLDCNVIHSFIPAISIAPLQVHYYSEALPTTARILYQSFTPKRTGSCR